MPIMPARNSSGGIEVRYMQTLSVETTSLKTPTLVNIWKVLEDAVNYENSRVFFNLFEQL